MFLYFYLLNDFVLRVLSLGVEDKMYENNFLILRERLTLWQLHRFSKYSMGNKSIKFEILIFRKIV